MAAALEEMETKLREFQKYSVEMHAGTTKYGQAYGIVVTKFAWYKIRVFLDVGAHYDMKEIGIYSDFQAPEAVYSFELKDQRRSAADCNIVLMSESEHLTERGMEERLHELKDIFSKPSFTQAVSLFGDGYSGSKLLNAFNLVKVPQNWEEDPEKYLLRGDLILSEFNPGVFHLFHAGIYLGGGKVAHLSGHGQGKKSAKARIGNVVGDFAHEKGWMAIVFFNPAVRDRAEIAKVAEDRVSDGYLVEGEYNILNNNCQQFAFSCVTDEDYCIDTKLKAWLPAPT